MNRRDWLVLFAAYEGAPDGLDPVRLQKGLFLFSMEADVPDAQKYTFKPYDYGPMSAGIYQDLDDLVGEGLLIQDPVPGKSWSRYRPSEAGVAVAHRLMRNMSADEMHEARRLFALKQDVASKGFATLLERVYDAYPEYATKSVFRRD